MLYYIIPSDNQYEYISLLPWQPVVLTITNHEKIYSLMSYRTVKIPIFEYNLVMVISTFNPLMVGYVGK